MKLTSVRFIQTVRFDGAEYSSLYVDKNRCELEFNQGLVTVTSRKTGRRFSTGMANVREFEEAPPAAEAADELVADMVDETLGGKKKPGKKAKEGA